MVAISVSLLFCHHQDVWRVLGGTWININTGPSRNFLSTLLRSSIPHKPALFRLPPSSPLIYKPGLFCFPSSTTYQLTSQPCSQTAQFFLPGEGDLTSIPRRINTLLYHHQHRQSSSPSSSISSCVSPLSLSLPSPCLPHPRQLSSRHPWVQDPTPGCTTMLAYHRQARKSSRLPEDTCICVISATSKQITRCV